MHADYYSVMCVVAFGDMDLSLVIITIHIRVWDLKMILGDIFGTPSVSLDCTSFSTQLLFSTVFFKLKISYKFSSLNNSLISNLGADVFWPISQYKTTEYSVFQSYEAFQCITLMNASRVIIHNDAYNENQFLFYYISESVFGSIACIYKQCIGWMDIIIIKILLIW